jgi:hypothetical protein
MRQILPTADHKRSLAIVKVKLLPACTLSFRTPSPQIGLEKGHLINIFDNLIQKSPLLLEISDDCTSAAAGLEDDEENSL